MWPLIKRLFLDETAFVGYLRAVLLGFGAAFATDLVTLDDIVGLGLDPAWGKTLGVLAMMGGGLIRSDSAAKAKIDRNIARQP